jgi:hypothetical protein
MNSSAWSGLNPLLINAALNFSICSGVGIWCFPCNNVRASEFATRQGRLRAIPSLPIALVSPSAEAQSREAVTFVLAPLHPYAASRHI